MAEFGIEALQNLYFSHAGLPSPMRLETFQDKCVFSDRDEYENEKCSCLLNNWI